VGEHQWDVGAAELGYGFIGVGPRATSLRAAGATVSFSDFAIAELSFGLEAAERSCTFAAA